jgi:peptidyl-prolyl cis-trans isomerase B (cyclophilin B)
MVIVIMHTNLGAISLEINEEAAPITAKNFLEYCNNGFYNGTIFHRIIDGFMIQGGGLNADLTQKTTNTPITNEANNNLKNEIGTIAMARTTDPHSATAQFFINVAKNDFLNFRDKSTQGWGYCVFGKVTAGMDIVKKISQVKTGNRGGYQDVPQNDIIIENVEVTVAEKQAT